MELTSLKLVASEIIGNAPLNAFTFERMNTELLTKPPALVF